jgi:hypothetical protein
MKGMSIEGVRSCAGTVDGKIGEVVGVLDGLKSSIDGLEWVGPDRDKFVGDVEAKVSSLRTAIEADLTWMKDTMTRNADSQETTSDVM